MVQNVKYKELAFLILPQNFLYQKKLSWGLISCFWLLRVELLGLATPRTLGIKNLPGSGGKTYRFSCTSRKAGQFAGSGCSNTSAAPDAMVLHEAPLCPKSLKALRPACLQKPKEPGVGWSRPSSPHHCRGLGQPQAVPGGC